MTFLRQRGARGTPLAYPLFIASCLREFGSLICRCRWQRCHRQAYRDEFTASCRSNHRTL